MALVRTITPDTMKETMKDYGRDYYSYEGCKAIIELFEETDCGNDTEFDPIAICCDFTETTPEDIKDIYGNLEEIDELGADEPERIVEVLNYHTWAQLLDNGNILFIEF